MNYAKTKFLMWTDITITIFWKENPDQDLENIFGIFHMLEEEFSRFKEESSLSILNRERELEVSNTFIDAIKKCKEIYTDTDLYFNPLINLRKIWYSKDFQSNEFIQEDKEIEVNLVLEKIEITWKKIRLIEGQKLDFWGIVKWYGVDKARAYLDKKWYKNYIVDAGGDIYTAGANEQWKKMVVGIDNPFSKGHILATIEIENKAIATSGIYKRKWEIPWGPEKESKKYHHIINPVNSINTNEIMSITLIGEECYLVDAYATACIAMWVDQTLDFLRKKKIDAVIICTNKKIYTTKGMKKYNLQFI